MKIQPVFRNLTLLFFVLLPAAPFMAATVNYDNAIILLTSLFMLIGVKIIISQEFCWQQYAQLILIGLTGSLMKVSFLPIFAAGFMFVFIRFIIKNNKRSFNIITNSFVNSREWAKVLILVPLIIVGFLFVERFAVNIIKYHSLTPSCQEQITKKRCMSNYVEFRAENLKKTRTGNPVQTPEYIGTWFVTMESGLLITAANTKGYFGTEMRQPLPIIYMTVFIGSIVSLATFFYSLKKMQKTKGFWLIVSVIIFYIMALFYINISYYYDYYQPIAIQGRYLLPLLPFILLFAVLSINYVMHNKRLFKLLLLIIVLTFYLNGAGVITHIIRSDESWNWDNKTVRQINNKARDIIKPFIKEWWYDR